MKRGRDKFNRYAPFINMLVRIFSMLPIGFLKKLYYVFQNTKGIKGLLIRYVLIKCISPSCGINVSIHPNVYLFYPEKITLGNHVSIHPMCYIDASGGLSIGDNVSIAHGVTILSSSHNYNRVDVPIKDQGMYFAKTIISSNVWIGAKATILCGLKISSGSIIGANSVVTKDVSENSIVAGVPAKVIKYRN